MNWWNEAGVPQEAKLIGTAPVCEWDERHPETGLTWRDMPGADDFFRKLTFFFYRRGLYKPASEAESELSSIAD